jgi:hypothetical protein
MSSIFFHGLLPQFYYSGTISVLVILMISDSCQFLFTTINHVTGINDLIASQCGYIYRIK